MRKIELLAPAGNMECLISAVNSGADAVYLGLDEFNARGNIENFNKKNLREGVRYAHLFGAKVYLALNILFKDSEIAEVVETVKFAIDCKVDAFIVQDIGVASLLKDCFEGIELHASTQMGIHNLEGAIFLKKLGFSRVVLARETPLSEIKRIKDNLDIEIEYFVQGAMCVGFSGNCYFSSLEQNASGNRGKCKQLCRLPYQMEYDGKKKEGYLLSIKDNCMLPVLNDLVDAGVTSLKIEGRARRSAYVATAVQVYRNALNNCCKYSQNDIVKLKKLFNRGEFTTGYFGGGKLIYPEIGSHKGVEIGFVRDFKKGNKFNEIYLISKHRLTRGDLIQFEKDGTIQAVSVYDVKNIKDDLYYITTTNSVQKGAKVSLLVDKALEEGVLEVTKKIEVDAFFEGRINAHAKLILRHGGVCVEVENENVSPQSQTQPFTEEECFSQLAKMGNVFNLKKLEFQSEKIFIRKSEINAMRRKALELLEEKIVEENEKHLIIKNKNNLIKNNKKIKENNKKMLIFNNINQIKDFSYDYFIYSPSIFTKDDISFVYKKMEGKKLFLDLPVFATKSDIEFLNEIISDCDKLGVVANNYYALNMASKDNTIIGSELNVFNQYAVDFYKNLGFNKIIISKEGLLDIAADETLFMHNNLKEKLIYFKHCPIKEHIGGDCSECRFKDGITYRMSGKTYLLKRTKLKSCLFYLQKVTPSFNYVDGFGRVDEI